MVGTMVGSIFAKSWWVMSLPNWRLQGTLEVETAGYSITEVVVRNPIVGSKRKNIFIKK